ncbi:MAG: cobalamin-dependent protein [Candidatus Helarchaeota archaeon]
MNEKFFLRFVMAILGTGNDLNAKVVSIAFRDSGFEIVYLGDNNTPDEIVRAALQEDVDAIYLSVPEKSSVNLIKETLDIAKNSNFFDSSKKFIFAGGVDLSNDEIQKLKDYGLTEIYRPSKKTHEIVENILKLFENN